MLSYLLYKRTLYNKQDFCLQKNKNSLYVQEPILKKEKEMTQVQLAEAIHVTTYWYRYRQSYVTLCNRVLMQRGLKLKGGEDVSTVSH